jgi:hypothetical protein
MASLRHYDTPARGTLRPHSSTVEHPIRIREVATSKSLWAPPNHWVSVVVLGRKPRSFGCSSIGRTGVSEASRSGSNPLTRTISHPRAFSCSARDNMIGRPSCTMGLAQPTNEPSTACRGGNAASVHLLLFRCRSTVGREILVLTMVVRVHSPDPLCGYGETGRLPRP